MKQDYETNNLIGAGEHATLIILKYLTKLEYQSLKQFPHRNGIYAQVPITWILKRKDLENLSEIHKKGSIDLFIVLNQKKIAVRVQGKGHGEGLRGLGKVKHDSIQYNLISQYCDIIDIKIIECPNVFKERTNESAIQEIISSFKTAGVMIPSL